MVYTLLCVVRRVIFKCIFLSLVCKVGRLFLKMYRHTSCFYSCEIIFRNVCKVRKLFFRNVKINFRNNIKMCSIILSVHCH